MNPGPSGTSPGSTVSSGFVKADSRNLPQVDYCSILEYMANNNDHNIAEIRGAKSLLSSRDSYLESAVGYVELMRNQSECLVRAKVTPEHRISNKNYVTTVTLDEKTNTIKETKCEGCPAAAGGCKHTLVFLFWLSKKSAEPASTSVECYWKKPKLSSARVEPLKAKNVFKNNKKIDLLPKNPNILKSFIAESKNHNNKGSTISLFTYEKRISYNIFDMTLQCAHNDIVDFDAYKDYLDQQITPDVITEIANSTKLQAESKLWHSIRQGRITGCTIYEASRCNCDGSLVQKILGGYKVPETKAILRGRKLEGTIIKKVERKIKKKIEKSGIILINSLIGASPDGLGDDFTVEVKCPTTQETLKTYIKNNKIQKKFAAQMQSQMLAANKARGLFCVADPAFEINKKIYLHWLKFDPVEANDLLEKATTFWKTHIFGKVKKSALS